MDAVSYLMGKKSGGSGSNYYTKAEIDAMMNGLEPYYLGKMTDFTNSNPLNLDNLDLGLYAIGYVGSTSNFYVSSTIGGVEYSQKITLRKKVNSANIENGIIILNLQNHANDVPVGSSFAIISYNEFYVGDTNEQTYWTFTLSRQTSEIIYNWSSAPFDMSLIDKAQTISAKKTFTVLPESSVAPTTDNQLVNKKYVDDNAGSGGLPVIEFSEGRYGNPFIINRDLKPGIYLHSERDLNVTFYYKIRPDEYSTYSCQLYDNTIHIVKNPTEEVTEQTTVAEITYYLTSGETRGIRTDKIRKNPNGSFVIQNGMPGDYIFPFPQKGRNESINGKYTFATLPECTVVPTTDGQLVNKKYVDDTVGDISTILESLVTVSSQGGE